MFRLPRRKAFGTKHDLGAGSLFDEIETHDRIVAWVPAVRPPSLHDPLIGDQLELTTRDVPAEQRKGAAHFPADLREFVTDRHSFHGRAKACDLIELLG